MQQNHNDSSNKNLLTDSSSSEPAKESEIFQSILHSMNSGVGLLSKNYTLLYSNAIFENLLGSHQQIKQGEKIYSETNLEIEQLKEIHQQLRRNKFWQGILPDLGKGVKVIISPISFSIPASLPHLADACFMVQVSDYSEQLKQQQELTQAKNLVKRSEKAKSEFLSHMSHELRTPLNAILGFTQLLKSEPELSAEQEDNLNEILSASNHLLKLINEILDLSHIENSALKLFSENIKISDLIAECISLTSPLAQKANIQIHQNKTRLSLANDRVRLKQALLNILSNAVRYNNDGGKVLIRTFATDNTIQIEIQDTGTGIPTQFLDTIFTPFSLLNVTDAPVQGRGIGLMLTRRLVQQMKGEVSVISMPGGGSIFSLSFPSGPSLLNENFYEANTRLFSKTRKILWIGPQTNSLQFAKNLTVLRPGLEFHHTENTISAIELQKDLKADLVFITIDESLTEHHQPSTETEFLLKKTPCIAVIDNSSYLEEQINKGLIFNSHLMMPINTIDFMKIIDDHFYRSMYGTA